MTEPESRSPLKRLKAMPGRTKLFFVVGLVLIIAFTTRTCSGVEIEEEEAVATALAALEQSDGGFVPEHTEARILRQGMPTSVVWVVVFKVDDPDPDAGRNEFLRHAAVMVNASTGEVINVDISEPDGG